MEYCGDILRNRSRDSRCRRSISAGWDFEWSRDDIDAEVLECEVPLEAFSYINNVPDDREQDETNDFAEENDAGVGDDT